MIHSLIRKIKKINIPNSYYIVMLVAIVSVIGVGYAVSISGAKKQVESTGTNQTREISDLSRRVSEDITLGMPKHEVIRRLGLPDWAAVWGDRGVLSTPDPDIALELRWKNPSCREVAIMFSPPPYRVIGWDDGAHFCKSQLPVEDRERYECTREDRRQYCR